jgi:hypothetical protein
VNHTRRRARAFSRHIEHRRNSSLHGVAPRARVAMAAASSVRSVSADLHPQCRIWLFARQQHSMPAAVMLLMLRGCMR